MSKVLTDKVLIEEFLNRGVDSIYPTKEALREKLMSGDRIKAYQGFDPTGPYLHVGHAMGIRALRILQKLGHEVIFLVGDFTAKVGDPDKTSARPILSDETIQNNMNGWKEQASQLIDFEGDNPVSFRHNFEWLSKLDLEDLIKLMASSTVQQMVERDMFERRLKEGDPIGLQEFIYPLMQGFDSVAMGVDLEIGGTDQTFNMLTGRTLVKQYLNKEKFVRTNQMMDAPDGVTMSKTKGNGINLKDTPEDMFGKAMSYPDSLIIKGFNLLTEVSAKDIQEIETAIKSGENPMKYKKIMAFEIVKLIKGESAAKKGQENFEKVVQNKEIDEENIISTSPAQNTQLLTFLKNNVGNELASQIKRVIEQGGVEVDGKQEKDPFKSLDFKSGTVIKFGKRVFLKVK